MPGVAPSVLMKEAAGFFKRGTEVIESRQHPDNYSLRRERKELQENMQRLFWENRDSLPDLSFRTMLEQILGYAEAKEVWGDMRDAQTIRDVPFFMESSVNTAMFSQITGQIAYTTIKQQYEMPQLIGRSLVTMSTTNYLDGEKIPGISIPADDFEIVGEDKPYPTVGVSAEYIETPRPVKRGAIIPVTREAIIADRLGILLARVRKLGDMMALNLEKRILRAVLGVDNFYKRNSGNNGQAIATYADNSGLHDWDNHLASNALQDYTDVENVLLAFNAIRDPQIDEPILVSGQLAMIVPQALEIKARNILQAREVRTGDVTSGYETLSPNPMSGVISRVVSSPYISELQGNSTSWYAGVPQRAFGYKHVWDVETVMLPEDSAMMSRDIAFGLKTGEFGTPYIEEPRYMIRCVQ